MVRSHPEWFGAAILDGFGYKQVWAIAQTVQHYLGDRYPIKLSQPFYNQPLTKDEFLDRVGKLIGPSSVAIVGLGTPWDHWTVATQITPRSIRFQDSYGIRRWDRTAVSVDRGESTTKVDCHQTILIRKS